MDLDEHKPKGLISADVAKDIALAYREVGTAETLLAEIREEDLRHRTQLFSEDLW